MCVIQIRAFICRNALNPYYQTIRAFSALNNLLEYLFLAMHQKPTTTFVLINAPVKLDTQYVLSTPTLETNGAFTLIMPTTSGAFTHIMPTSKAFTHVMPIFMGVDFPSYETTCCR